MWVSWPVFVEENQKTNQFFNKWFTRLDEFDRHIWFLLGFCCHVMKKVLNNELSCGISSVNWDYYIPLIFVPCLMLVRTVNSMNPLSYVHCIYTKANVIAASLLHSITFCNTVCCIYDFQLRVVLQILHQIWSCTEDHGIHRFTIPPIGILLAIFTSVSFFPSSLFVV